MQYFLIILVLAALCGIIGAVVSNSENRGVGFALGLFLGPIGVIVAAILGNRATRPAHYGAPAPVVPQRSRLDDAPDTLNVRRKGEVIGVYPLADALDYLSDGRLLPTDQYQTADGTWSLMKFLQ